MHLINVETMLLEEFFGASIPPYAILSHTWGKNHEEIHFEELGSKDTHNKCGYQKIRYLCQQARKDKLNWAWCDTCCINKSSSAELSESINSMFQWYLKASVCYAYLADVSGPKDDENTINQLRKSRWFTRGWTLQELVAPEKVHFYDKNWQFLGSKRSLINHLVDITRVNFGALCSPWTIPTYSIATRMSWAVKRTTTRTEDQAYCMLGILGVHMPLLYGEGQNAFRRLQVELINISGDETIFAHSGPDVLAKSPEEFSYGHYLTVLKKSTSAPYSITNAGLRVDMRVLSPEINAGSTHDRAPTLGILNCHYNTNAHRNFYLALAMEPTGMDNTYRKASSSLQYVHVDQVTAVEYQPIFIQLQAAQTSRITLLEDYDRSQYSSEILAVRSIIVRNPYEKEVRIYPTPPFEYETVLYTFEMVQDKECQPFGVITFFDLISNTAGVTILPNYSWNPDDRRTLDMKAKFQTWKDEGRPASGELYIPSPKADPGERIQVTVKQKNEMAQAVWFLQIVRN